MSHLKWRIDMIYGNVIIDRKSITYQQKNWIFDDPFHKKAIKSRPLNIFLFKNNELWEGCRNVGNLTHGFRRPNHLRFKNPSWDELVLIEMIFELTWHALIHFCLENNELWWGVLDVGNFRPKYIVPLEKMYCQYFHFLANSFFFKLTTSTTITSFIETKKRLQSGLLSNF